MIWQFIDMYSNEHDNPLTTDRLQRRMFCDFLAGSLCIISAREADRGEDEVRQYPPVLP